MPAFWAPIPKKLGLVERGAGHLNWGRVEGCGGGVSERFRLFDIFNGAGMGEDWLKVKLVDAPEAAVESRCLLNCFNFSAKSIVCWKWTVVMVKKCCGWRKFLYFVASTILMMDGAEGRFVLMQQVSFKGNALFYFLNFDDNLRIYKCSCRSSSLNSIEKFKPNLT